MEAYDHKLKELAKTLMQLILTFLNIQMNWVDSSTSNPATALQLNSYPRCPDPTRAMGLAPHTDTLTSLFTILHQTGTGSRSLHLFKEGVGWGSIVTTPTTTNTSSLVVNIGDFLDILSNGRFHSVVHRVVLKEPQHRFTTAYFYMPPLAFAVYPHPPLLDSYRIPRYRSISVKEYVGVKNKEFGKALGLIRI